MCLIALAHHASDRYPLVLGANRDEDYERTTRTAQVWEDAPDVVGGRDALYGGSWLAIARNGRFAAVTNLRGAVPKGRSRGLLVRSFVTGTETPEAFAASIELEHYAGFHLIAGEAGGTVVYVPSDDTPRVLDPGVYGFSNAPSQEQWPKTAIAVEAMSAMLASPADLTTDLLQFLRTPRNTGRVEEEVFIAGNRYGTRASTVVMVSRNEIFFTEQNYTRGGAPVGALFQWSGGRPRPPTSRE
jgi:uncharacterized protein with NRDE domain